MKNTPMTPRTRTRTRLAAGLALAGAGAVAAIFFTTAPAGCGDCARDCPIATAVIETRENVDPGILGLAWVGPACPPVAPSCRGDDRSTFCNHINVSGYAPGICDVLIKLDGREPMAVRIEFGPPSGQGCCKGYPVVGESYFIIPLSMDAGIQGVDGSSDAVRILRDAGDDAPAADAGAADDAADGGASDDAAGAAD
jgi:hypothetical protein